VSEARPGLRERKKEATVEKLRQVALELFTERGFDAVSVDDVAEAADVSKTTVYRYFPSKEDLLLGRALEQLASVREAFAERPAEESPVEAARHALRPVVEAHAADPRQKRALSALVRSTPSLAAGSQANQAAWEEMLREEIARRRPAADPFEIHLLAAELLACVRAATNYWLTDGADRDLAELVDEAMRRLEARTPASLSASLSA
jgi:AcrR family transcriptional regulator